MTFEIVGDEIRFDGDTVAVFAPGVLATVRARVESALNEYVDPDECPSCEALTKELDEDCPECETLRDELEDRTSERDAAEGQRDAYAALLGIA